MSLTGSDEFFASVHESGMNDFVHAFFTARPHYLHYGSPMFVPTSTASETRMDPINFPGVPGGIQWAVDFTIPIIDLFDDDSGGAMPPQITLNVEQLTIRTSV